MFKIAIRIITVITITMATITVITTATVTITVIIITTATVTITVIIIATAITTVTIMATAITMVITIMAIIVRVTMTTLKWICLMMFSMTGEYRSDKRQIKSQRGHGASEQFVSVRPYLMTI